MGFYITYVLVKNTLYTTSLVLSMKPTFCFTNESFFKPVAVSGGDYDTTSMILTFTSGSSSGEMCIMIPIEDDNIVESSETIMVILSLEDGAELTSTTVTILDNEGNNQALCSHKCACSSSG